MLRLLDNSAILLHGADAHAGAFDRFAQSLDQLTTTLAAKTPTIDRFLRDSAPTTRLVNSLITENGSAVASCSPTSPRSAGSRWPGSPG